jgi:tRNA pseudouridine55 synthase
MHGLILVDKPQWATSHDVVDRIRRILGQQRVGHFGTLDPLATGLLQVAVGTATRLFPCYSRHDKIYQGEMRLGWATDTYDSQGKPTSEECSSYPEKQILGEAMKKFVGPLEQVPPSYSAKKMEGKPLYKWARSNKAMSPGASPVMVYEFNLKDYSPPLVYFDIHCGPGTYVRSLIHDLGQALGCGAHLAGLRRLAAGRHGIDDAFSLVEIDNLAAGGHWDRFLIPLESLLPECAKAVLSAAGCRLLQKGRLLPDELILKVIPSVLNPVPPDECSKAYRLFSPEGRFLALARPVEDKKGLLPFLVL